MERRRTGERVKIERRTKTDGRIAVRKREKKKRENRAVKERERERDTYRVRPGQERQEANERSKEERSEASLGGIGARDETRRDRDKEGRNDRGRAAREKERTVRGFGRSAGSAGASVRLETPARTERWLPPLFGTYVRCVPSITPCPPNRSLVYRGSVAQSVVRGVLFRLSVVSPLPLSFRTVGVFRTFSNSQPPVISTCAAYERNIYPRWSYT